jgi:hypothetical protein
LPSAPAARSSSFQTTVLLTVDDTVAALQKASSIKYRPPGEKG